VAGTARRRVGLAPSRPRAARAGPQATVHAFPSCVRSSVCSSFLSGQSIALVAWRRPLLGAELRRKRGRVGLEARLPRVRARLESGQPVEAYLPARGVSSGAIGRKLIDEHQAGAAAVGRELES